MYQELIPYKDLLDSILEISHIVEKLKDNLLNDEGYKKTIDDLVSNQKNREIIF